MAFNFKYHLNLVILVLLSFLTGCQLKEPLKSHGILFLENRSNQVIVDKTNQNDVLNLIGHPHSKYIGDENAWIYVERTLTKGKYHKLGRHVLKENNVLVLTFDKYGVLREKKLYKKEDIKKISFSGKKTDNELTKKSFIQSFLSSVKEKMYGGRK